MYKTYKELHNQYEPLIYHILKRLHIYRNRQELYRFGVLNYGSIRRVMMKIREIKSYAFSYIVGRMKTKLSNETKIKEQCSQIASLSSSNTISIDVYSLNLTNSSIESIALNHTPLKSKWLKTF